VKVAGAGVIKVSSVQVHITRLNFVLIS
jgi:hypothetical protein